MLVARTDPDQPKHRGITYFIVDMDQPGIEVRPLKQMDGGATFNEVFLTDAVVSNDAVIGDVNNGWMVAVSTLAYERQGIGGRGAGGVAVGAPGEKNGLLDKPVGELKQRLHRPRGDQPMTAGTSSPAALFVLARERGVSSDAVTRQSL